MVPYGRLNCQRGAVAKLERSYPLVRRHKTTWSVRACSVCAFRACTYCIQANLQFLLRKLPKKPVDGFRRARLLAHTAFMASRSSGPTCLRLAASSPWRHASLSMPSWWQSSPPSRQVCRRRGSV